MKRWIILAAIVVIGGGVGLWWWLSHLKKDTNELVLYGNIDLRQVQLAFNNSERISAVLVQEGDRVKPGQIMAQLDVSRLEPPVAQAEAQAASQRQVVARLHNGS